MATIERESLRARSRARNRTLPALPRLAWDRLVLMLLALLVVYPLWEIVRVSLLDVSEVRRPGASIWPLDLGAYVEAWVGIPFPRYMLNSLIVTLAVTLGNTLTAVLAAYAFSRTEFFGRELLFLLVIGSLMIPSHVTLIPNYLTFAGWGMLDTHAALILPFLASGFSVFFLRQYMLGIPKELDEAARIDGAGLWTILWTIMVPLSWPAISVVALFAFMSQWNEFIWPLLSTSSEEMRTIQIGLRYLLRDQEEGGSPDWPLVMAGTMIALMPLLIAYLVAERHLIRGITMGSFR
ncbi:MAG: carbohydrate ABC transporter permease [Pseudomonadota bacterium]